MKYLIFSYLGLSFLILPANGWASTNLMVSSYSPSDGRDLGYWVRADELSSDITWNPDTDILPIDLSREFWRAKAYAEARLTHPNGISLSFIELISLERPILISGNKRVGLGGALTNHWIIDFRLRDNQPPAASPQNEINLVTLFSGVVARQRELAPVTADKRINTNSSTSNKTESKAEAGGNGTRASGGSQAASGHGSDKVAEVGAKVSQPRGNMVNVSKLLTYDPELKVPNIQWDPYKERFPFDIAAGQRAAKAYLLSQAGVEPNGLRFYQIQFFRFLPRAAIQAQHLDTSAHLNHWEITFSYWVTADPAKSVSVEMLLDGTIYKVNFHD